MDNVVQKQFYSGNKKWHTLKYEVAVNRRYGFICWVAGAYVRPMHNMKCTRITGLLAHHNLLDASEQILSDKAYVGDSLFVTPIKNPSTKLEHAFNMLITKE